MKGKDGAKKTPFRSSLRCEVRRETSTPGRYLIRRHDPGRLLASLQTPRGLAIRGCKKMLRDHLYTGEKVVSKLKKGRTEPRRPSQKLIRETA